MNRKEAYRDMEKFRITRNRQKRRYYGKTQDHGRNHWTCQEDELVLAHTITDMALSGKIGHSVAAIQHRRYRLKKAAADNA